MFRKIVCALCALFCASALFGGATGATTPPGWLDDYREAQDQSNRLNRPILLLLTGSDWCPHCIRLRREILLTPEFKRFAADRLVLLFSDSPSQVKLSPLLTEQNRQFSEKYRVDGVPCTLIIDSTGRELGRISGCPNNLQDYLKQIGDAIAKLPPPKAKPGVLPPPPHKR